MKVVILNQAFYPDVVSTAQHASDLAAELAARGHEVIAISSRRAYDHPEVTFAKRERWNGVTIRRVPCLGLGKRAKWRRALDFASYFVTSFFVLLSVSRCDVVIGLTSPPLISAMAALYAQLRRCRFVFWVMDLNPDEAIAAGWLAEDSWVSRGLKATLRYSLNRADSIVTLDRHMAHRVEGKGVPAHKIRVIPPWSHDRALQYDQPGREAFRSEHGLSNKFVVMYSGNHSLCHPLTTLLEAAEKLADDPDIAFCFVGGGSEFRTVREFAKTRGLANVTCLPYQPLNKLSASLSAADLHVVVLGEPFVGIVHPCKIYNILVVERPVLYIGPPESHVTEILSANRDKWAYVARHGDVNAVVESIRTASTLSGAHGPQRELARAYSQAQLLPEMCSVIETGLADGTPLVPITQTDAA